MKVVLKYPMSQTGYDTFEMPINAKIVHVEAIQRTEQPCMWVLLDPTETLKETRRFIIAHAGEKLDDREDYQYVGTFLLRDGAFVGHIFEIT